MKNVAFLLVIVLAFAACETPQQIKSAPDNTTNTSGTTGSATMTNKSPATESGNTPVAGKDSLGRVKDSLPK